MGVSYLFNSVSFIHREVFFKYFLELKPQDWITKLWESGTFLKDLNILCHVGTELVYTQLIWVLNFPGLGVQDIFGAFPHTAPYIPNCAVLRLYFFSF